MRTRQLTEQIQIETLSATTTNGGEIANNYVQFKTVYGSILNDSGTDNNQNGNTSFKNGVQYSERTRIYIRYLPITLNNNMKKQYRVTWNSNNYFIVGIKHVANRSASIIEVQASV